jgi:SAM-dependent methyltransferase
MKSHDSERAAGIYRFLSLASVYDLVQSAVGSTKARRTVVNDYFGPAADLRILDVGCGTAQLFRHLSGSVYHGFDPNPDYISTARRAFGDSIHVWQATIGQPALPDGQKYDIVHAGGVAHHVDDDTAARLFQLAAECLKPLGKLVTIDPCLYDGQSLLSRAVVKRDRGRFVRNPGEYDGLANPAFENIESLVRNDLLRIPYSHLVMVATGPKPAAASIL